MEEKKYPLHQKKFITLLRTLGQKERSAFEYYLKGLHYKQEKAIAVFKCIKSSYPNLEKSKKLEAAYVFKKAFKRKMGSDKDRKNLLNYFSDLYLWLREFLLWKAIQEPSLGRELQWLEILKERKLDQLFFLKIARMKAKYKDWPAENIWHYLQLMELSHLEFFHTNNPKLKAESPALDSAMKYLDLFFATAKLKYASEKLNRKNLFQITPSLKFTNLALEVAKNNPEKKLLHLYKLLFQLNKTPSLTGFQAVKQLLFSHSKEFELQEQIIVLGYLLNFTASRTRHDGTTCLQEAFELNQYGLETGILLEDGFLSSSIFHNIVNLACRLGNFNWAETFVKEYRHSLKQPIENDAARIAQATIAFEKKDFRKVLMLLDQIEFADIHFALRAKTLKLRSYVELDESQDIILFCETFEKFVKRCPTLKGDTATATMNFIRFVKILNREKAARQPLISEITNTHPLFFKSWLLQKAAVYQQKFATRSK